MCSRCSIPPRWRAGWEFWCCSTVSIRFWTTLRPRPRWNLSAHVAAPIAGLFGGIVGTAFGTMASVFFAMYFDTLRKGKEQFRATMSAILLALVALRGAGYWAVGEYSADVLILAGVALPLMFAGLDRRLLLVISRLAGRFLDIVHGLVERLGSDQLGILQGLDHRVAVLVGARRSCEQQRSRDDRRP
jgi:hypothetical protein